MSRSNKFPDVREFRSRLRTMGFSTGAENHGPPKKTIKKTSRKQQFAATSVLWSGLGVGGIAILGWLAIDMGGPKQLMTALVSVNDTGQRLAYFDRRNMPLAAESHAQLTTTNSQSADKEIEVLALQRRVVMLENMLTGSPQTTNLALGPPVLGPPVLGPPVLGPPRTTASISNQRQSNDITLKFAPLVEKSDLPSKSSSARAPTAPIDRPTGSRRNAGQFATGTMTRPMTTGATGKTTNSASRSRFATQSGFGLDLGAYSSLAILRKNWMILADRNSDVLGDLAPRHLTEFSANGNVAHRLIAAPLGDAMDVAKRCAALKARSVSCKQTQGTGEPLL